MTPRYKYRDKYFKAVMPFPTLTQLTTHCLGNLLGMQRPASSKAAGKRTRKTFAMAFVLNKYFSFSIGVCVYSHRRPAPLHAKEDGSPVSGYVGYQRGFQNKPLIVQGSIDPGSNQNVH
jgi:hypothetical protein